MASGCGAGGAGAGRDNTATAGARDPTSIKSLLRHGFKDLFEKHLQPGGVLLSWDRDPYVLDEIGEASLRDRASVVALRIADGRDRIIARSWNDNVTHEIFTEPGHLDRVVEEFCEWTERL